MSAACLTQRLGDGAKQLGEILGRSLRLVGDGGGHVAAGHGEAEAKVLEGVGLDGGDDLFRHTGRAACLAQADVGHLKGAEGLRAFCDRAPTGDGYADWFLAWHFRTPEERMLKRLRLRAATMPELSDAMTTGDFDVMAEFLFCGLSDDVTFHLATRKRQALRRGKAALAILSPRPDDSFDASVFLAAWKAAEASPEPEAVA